MVQLVFVHGVANRAGPDFNKNRDLRDSLFRQGAFAGQPLDIENPYWGDKGGSLVFGELSLPRKGKQAASFSLLGKQDQGAGAPTIAQIAAKDFGAAIDVLYALLVERAAENGDSLEPAEMAEFMAAAAYAEANPKPAWVDPDLSDDQFIKLLRQALNRKKPASYGLLDKVQEAADAIVDSGRNLVAQGLVGLVRDKLNPLVAAFLGDVFVYLRDGDRRQAIRHRVAQSIAAAHGRKLAGGGPLILAGHSLGGVILYDMLTDPKGAGLPDDLQVDVFLTVGSQPGFFEEMKLFAASDPAIVPGGAKALAAKPSATHWWNVYDPVDVISFRCQGIFEGAEDFMFSSVGGVLDTHGSYFHRPRLHERLRARLAALAK